MVLVRTWTPRGNSGIKAHALLLYCPPPPPILLNYHKFVWFMQNNGFPTEIGINGGGTRSKINPNVHRPPAAAYVLWRKPVPPDQNQSCPQPANQWGPAKVPGTSSVSGTKPKTIESQQWRTQILKQQQQ